MGAVAQCAPLQRLNLGCMRGADAMYRVPTEERRMNPDVSVGPRYIVAVIHLTKLNQEISVKKKNSYSLSKSIFMTKEYISLLCTPLSCAARLMASFLGIPWLTYRRTCSSTETSL
jgi:hypothetical protein